MFHAWEKLKTH